MEKIIILIIKYHILQINHHLKRLTTRLLVGVIMNVFSVLKNHKNEIFSKYSVKRIGIFGSYAKGQQKEESDVDVLVEFEKPTFDNFMELSFFLEGLFGKKVDLLTPKSLSPYMRPYVEKEVVWCE